MSNSIVIGPPGQVEILQARALSDEAAGLSSSSVESNSQAGHDVVSCGPVAQSDLQTVGNGAASVSGEVEPGAGGSPPGEAPGPGSAPEVIASTQGVFVIPLCVRGQGREGEGEGRILSVGVDTLIATVNVKFNAASWPVIAKWLDRGRQLSGNDPTRRYVDRDSSGHEVTHYPGAGAGLYNWYYHVSLLGGHVWISRETDNGNVGNVRIKCEASAIRERGAWRVFDDVEYAVTCWGSDGVSDEKVGEVHIAFDCLAPGFDYPRFVFSATPSFLDRGLLQSDTETGYLGKRGGPREWCVYAKGKRVVSDADDWGLVDFWGIPSASLPDVVRLECRLRRAVFREWPSPSVMDTMMSLNSIVRAHLFGRLRFGPEWASLESALLGAVGRLDSSSGLVRRAAGAGRRLDAAEYLHNRLLPALVGYASRVGEAELWRLLQRVGEEVACESEFVEFLRLRGVEVPS